MAGPNEKPGDGKPQEKPEAKEMDKAHHEAGDGVLESGVPAGLTVKELREVAEGPAKDVGATG
jgi:hypothetical protein